jgi:hypothetical protein
MKTTRATSLGGCEIKSGKRNVRALLIAGLLFGALTSAAHAAPITHTYYVLASGFSSIGAPPPPVTTWNVIFTITFDPAVDASGASLDSFSSADLSSTPYGPTYLFAYDATSRTLNVGDNCPTSSLGCTLSGQDALISLSLNNPDAPVFNNAHYRIAVGSQTYDYRSSTGTASTEAFNQVPEPAPFALLGLGLAGLAASRRRKQ